MRGAFGLVSLLVAVGIVVWLFSKYEIPMAREGRKASEQAQQIQGLDPNGENPLHSVTLEAFNKDGKFAGLTVLGMVSGGSMQNAYGLQVNDLIVQAGELPFDGYIVGDAELAKAKVFDAYREQRPLIVVRGGEKISLVRSGGLLKIKPDQSADNTPGAATPAPANPAAVPQPANRPRSVRERVEDIQKAMPQ